MSTDLSALVAELRALVAGRDAEEFVLAKIVSLQSALSALKQAQRERDEARERIVRAGKEGN